MMGKLVPVILFSLIAFPDGILSFNCTKSALCMKEIENIRIEFLKQELIDQIPDLASPPRATKEMRPEYKQFYNEFLNELNAKDYANRQDVDIAFYTAKDPSEGEDESQLVASFDVRDDLEKNELIEAELVVSTNVPKNEESTVQDVMVQVYEKNADQSKGEMVTSKVFSIKGNQILRIPLPPKTVTGWYTTSPISGLFVSAMLNGHNVAIHPQQATKDEENMILQLSMNKPVGRTRRSAASPICSEKRPSEGCCLYDMVIDFEKIGWDWIVAPPRYNAYMCRGNCKLNSHHFGLSETGHSKIMRAAGRMGGEYQSHLANVGYCCHPTEYDYIKLIYVNRDGRVSVANVNGMIARRCGCS